jgi:hypothetical protein
MLKNILIAMTEKLCFRMRSEHKLTSCVTVKIRYSNFDTHTMQCRIPYTSHDHTIIARVKELFDKVYNRRLLIRLVGVKFSHIVGGGAQINLFDDKEEIIKLYQAMDRMRRVYGAHAVERAVGANFSLRSFNPFNGIASEQRQSRPKDEDACEYLIALNLPGVVSGEVREIKNEFHEKYNHHEVLKSAAMITLADFRMNEEGEENLIHSLEEVNRHQPSVKVTLKNFGHAGTHTIFIDVVKPTAIVTLVKSLKKKLQLPGSQSFFAFKPYLPVAKNLTEEKFKTSFADFQQREFSASFIACSMSLMKRKSKQDNYLLIKEFEYSDAGAYVAA